MFLHVVDDEKFIDVLIELFEEVNQGKNRFIALVHKPITHFHYVKLHHWIEQIIIDSADYWKLIELLPSFNAVCLHYLFDEKCKFINDAQGNVKFAWFFWGQDAQKLFVDKAYLSHTRSVAKQIYGIKEWIWPYTNWIRRLYLPYTSKGHALKKIQYCAPVIKEELEQMQRKLKLKYIFLDFNYCFFPHEIPKTLPGKNILVGNSATLACNHIDTFLLLKKIDIQDRKIIVPLSYGNKQYRNIVINSGKSLFGDSFIPLIDFMPIEEYNAILNSCGVFIMNHLRQQAMGNINIALWNGAKVYINEKNIVFKHLKNRNFIVSSIQKELKQSNLLVFDHLTKESIKSNQQLILKYYGQEIIKEKVNNIVRIFA